MTADLLDPDLAVALAAAVLAGVVRGFSGFGAALILTPALAALHGPTFAVPAVLLMELLVSLQLLPAALPIVERRTVVLGAAASLAFVPVGTWILLHAERDHLRLAFSLVILLFVVLLAAGLRRRGRESTAALLGAGAIAGICGGAAGTPGPPLILYLLSGGDTTVRIRASLICLFALIDAAALAALALGDGLAAAALLHGLVLTPPFLLAAWLGGRLFGRSGERLYRNVALTVIAAVALASLLA